MTPVIVVIGAGPAGCAAALTAGADCQTIVLERGEAGKDKPCGDALMASAVRHIQRFGIDDERLHALGAQSFDAIDISDPARQRLRRPSLGTGYLLRRRVIDQALRDAIAPVAAIHYQTIAVSIDRDKYRGWIVSARSQNTIRQIRCDAVILATGSASLFPRRFGLDGSPCSARSITCYVDSQRLAPRPGISFDLQRTSYEWVFPLQTGANLGCIAFNAVPVSQLKDKVELLKTKCGDPRPGRLRGGLLDLWSGKGQSWHDMSGVVSCGDAAGIVDPYSGEGISGALESGFRAGAACSRFAREKTQDALEAYSVWLRDTFSRKYAYAKLAWSLSGLAPWHGAEQSRGTRSQR